MILLRTRAEAPVMRGLLHEYAIAPAALVGVVSMFVIDGIVARFAIAVHVATLVLLLSTSAVYHRHAHDPLRKRYARKADHAAIYGLIAGSYTPVCLLALDRRLGIPVLLLVWMVALNSMRVKFLHLELGQDRMHSWMFPTLGGAAILIVPWMLDGMGWTRLGLVVLGGAFYLVGGLVLITKRPDPWPAVFGFHEIWHVMVLLGASLHLAVSLSLAV